MTAPLPNARHKVWVSRVLGDDHYKPCRNGCGTLKSPHCSMAMSAEQRSKFADLHRPSPATVTSPYEWKFLEWDDKLKTNKQTNKYIWFCREFLSESASLTADLVYLNNSIFSITPSKIIYGICKFWRTRHVFSKQKVENIID